MPIDVIKENEARITYSCDHQFFFAASWPHIGDTIYCLSCEGPATVKAVEPMETRRFKQASRTTRDRLRSRLV